MKFRVLVSILVIAIISLFTLVVKFSVDIKNHEKELEATNAELSESLKVSDSLKKVTEDHFNILQKATDSIYFSVAKKSNTFRSYKNYINTIGKDGEYYEAALINLGSFFPKKGYVQFIETSGNNLYDLFTETDNFPEEPITFNNEPSVAKSNLYRATRGATIRNGVFGNDDYPNRSSTGDQVRPGQLVKVLKIIESGGDSRWIHIAYGDN